MKFALLAVGAAAAASAAAPSLGPIVGQITTIEPAGSKSVMIKRGAAPSFAARPYQSLYSGDQITVQKKGVQAQVEIEGDTKDHPVELSTGAFQVPTAHGGNAPTKALQAFLGRWSFVFAPNPAPSVVTTTPRSAEFEPSSYLPEAPQQVRAGLAQRFPVVWRGGKFRVTLVDAEDHQLAGALSQADGLAVLPCPALAAGSYKLYIGRETIPVLAVSAPPDRSSPMDQALRASAAVRGPPGAQLQALGDLQTLSTNVYIARAVLRAIERAP